MPSEHMPKKWVKITLSAHWQNKLLLLLTRFGIHESFVEDHILYMNEKLFVELLFAAKDADISVSISQLKAEYVDMHKEPRITVCRPHNMTYQKLEKP